MTADPRRVTDREVVARVREFTGHVQDTPEDEKLFLLGDLAEAVERLLGDLEDPNAGRCRGPGGCFPGEPCDYADVCSGHSG